MKNQERRRISFFVRMVQIFLSLFLLGGQYTHAQQTVTSATLSGPVEDARGPVVSGANLTATNRESSERAAFAFRYQKLFGLLR